MRPVLNETAATRPSAYAGYMQFKTAALDSAGLFAVIWSIPLAIIILGAPVALAFLAARELARWLF
jgi:hypothetical protein